MERSDWGDIGGNVRSGFEPVREIFARVPAGRGGIGPAAAWRDGEWVAGPWGETGRPRYQATAGGTLPGAKQGCGAPARYAGPAGYTGGGRHFDLRESPRWPQQILGR
jgi:hypothetical protein